MCRLNGGQSYGMPVQKHQTKPSSRGALSFSILDAAVLSGEIPIAKTRLVQAWIEIHRESLLADWELAVNGQAPFAIDPLR